MTLEEAEEVAFVLQSIKLCKETPARLMNLAREGQYSEVLRIACEIASELQRKYENDLKCLTIETNSP